MGKNDRRDLLQATVGSNGGRFERDSSAEMPVRRTERAARRRDTWKAVAAVSGILAAGAAAGGYVWLMDSTYEEQRMDKERDTPVIAREVAEDGFVLEGQATGSEIAWIDIRIPDETGTSCVRQVEAKLERDASNAIVDISAYSYGGSPGAMGQQEVFTFHDAGQLRRSTGPNPCNAPALNQN